jgi:hypothetical protein
MPNFVANTTWSRRPLMAGRMVRIGQRWSVAHAGSFATT